MKKQHREGSMTPTQADYLATKGQWFRIWMPYCFVRLVSPPKYVYLPLNRNYKPLGYPGREHVEYESYRAQAVQFKTDPKMFDGMWALVEADRIDDEVLWLYTDTRKTRLDYFKRLEKLVLKGMKLVGEGEMV
jgi:hypothetical protein